jgi:hypothetical protein
VIDDEGEKVHGVWYIPPEERMGPGFGAVLRLERVCVMSAKQQEYKRLFRNHVNSFNLWHLACIKLLAAKKQNGEKKQDLELLELEVKRCSSMQQKDISLLAQVRRGSIQSEFLINASAVVS